MTKVEQYDINKRSYNRERRRTMKTLTICAHTIEYWYQDENGLDFKGDMPQVEIEHVQEALIDNYVQGELQTTIYNPEPRELSGWWRIAGREK